MKIEPTILPFNKYESNDSKINKINKIIFKKDIDNFCKKNTITPNIFLLASTVLCLTKFINNTDIYITINNNSQFIFREKNRNLSVKNYIDLIKNCWDTLSNETTFNSDNETFNYFYNEHNTELNLNNTVNLIINQNTDNFILEIHYNSFLYSKTYIETFLNSIETIIKQFLKSDSNKLKICDIALREEVKPSFKQLRNPLVNELLEEQANKTPNKIAIRISDEKYTFKEINELSNRIANALIKKGIKKGSRILFMLRRDINLIITFLGIIKAGCIAIPLDMFYPKDRIQYIKENSQAKYIITNDELEGAIKPSQLLKENNSMFPQVPLNPDDPIFILYTSGSTGHPKGVVLAHKGISNLISTHIKLNYKKLLSISSISFDISEEDILVALTNGIELIFANDDEINDIILLSKLIKKTKPEFLNLTPSRILSYLEVPEFRESIGFFKGLGIGGEPFTKIVYETIRTYSDADIYNGYGPAETSLTSNSKKIENPDFITNGKPLKNYITDVRDIDKKLLPYGVIGELYIGGVGVGKGYYNQEEKTKEAFIKINELPYYKTGDNAIQLPNNEIIIKERIDNQIKLRGQRVEPNEIEYIISKFPNINKVVVILQKINNEKHLCAYFTSKVEINENKLKTFLKSKLSDYMIPTIFMQIEKIPETPNGKTDKKQLPKPIIKTEKIKPTTELEKTLHELCVKIIKYEKFGITDNLFTLGFTSLSFMTLNSDIYHTFGLALKHTYLMNKPTIKEIAQLINKNKNKKIDEIPKIKERNDNSYLMSSQQKRLYTIYKNNPKSTVYNLPEIIEINQDINISKLETIINNVINEEEILRTSFHIEDGEYIQKVHKNRPIEIKCLNTDKIGAKDIIYQNTTPFNLETDPLLRIKIIENKNKRYLFRDIHHIISDQISNQTLYKKIKTEYLGKKSIKNKIQYKDYINWVETQQKQEEKYWKEKNILKTPTSLITDFKRPLKQTFNGNNLIIKLNKKIIEKQVKNNNTTIYKLLLAQFLILLHKYTCENEIQIGTITSGRTHPSLEHSLGIFVNTLPYNQQISPEYTLKQILEETNIATNKLFENQNYPPEKLIEDNGIPMDNSSNPLYNIIFSQNTVEDDEEIYITDTSKFDLTCNILNAPSNLKIRIEYNSDLFTEKKMQQFLKHYNYLISNFDKNLNKKIKDIKILSRQEEKKLLEKFNKPLFNKKQSTILSLFKDKVNNHPSKIILCDKSTSISYKELDEKTNSLANYLKDSYDIKNQDKILVITKRSIESVIAFYSIVKLNAVYIPINPSTPLERIKIIINDSNAKLILTNISLENLDVDTINLNQSQLFEYKINEIETLNNHKDDLSHIIYTSGTSGLPKGVQITQRNINNLISDSLNHVLQNNIKDEIDLIYSTNNLAFDVSFMDLLFSILYGVKLFVIDENFDFTIIPNEIIKEKSFIATTPSLMRMFLTLPNFKNIIKNTKTVCLLGEVLTEDIINLIWKYSNTKIYNGYGPSEATTFNTIKEITDIEDINIGRPIANNQAYILNKEKQLCPIGVVGELYLGGKQISNGYLNNKSETEKKFIKTDYSDEKIYSTGDLCYWKDNGDICYLGRSDLQIKINGQRIDANEINNQIQKNNQEIIQAVTVANNEKNKLYSFITAKTQIDTNEILNRLWGILPPYMIPISIMQVKSIPLNNNGKVDVKKLPKPTNKTSYIEPKTPIEKLIVKTWEKILKISPIGINDNFYHIGGDSIKAIRIIAILNQKKYNLSAELLRLYPTPKQLAKHVKKLKITSEKGSEIKGVINLTPIQQEFFDRNLNNPNHYNQSLLLESEKIDKIWLKNAFNIMSREHPMLRAIYPNNTQTIKPYLENSHFSLEEHKINNEEEINDIGNKMQSSLNIENGPLVKLGLIHGTKKDYLLIIMHHLIVDGVSWRIILENLELLHENINTPLIKENTLFTKWSETLKKYEKSLQIKEKEYWKHITNNINPTSYKKNNKMKKSRMLLDEEITQNIIFKINEKFNTQINDILLHSLLIALKNTFNKEKIVIGLEGHGREPIDDVNLSQTIGWFTTKYPVLFENITDDIKLNLINTKETLRKIPKKGIGYQLLNKKTYKQPNILFNYLGTFTEENENVNFKINNLPHGQEISNENMAQGILSIEGIHQMDKLYFDLEYDSSKITYNQIKSLKTSWINTINKTIAILKESDKIITPSDLNEYDLSFDQITLLLEQYNHNIEKIYKLSPLQSYMLTNQSKNNFYRIQNTIKTSKPLKKEIIHKILEYLVNKYDILRTRIDFTFLPRQILLKKQKIEFDFYEINDLNNLKEIEKRDFERGFKINQESLIRLTAVVHKNSTYLIWSISHLITDGWSFNIILNDFFKLYKKIENNEEITEKTLIPFNLFLEKLNEKNREESLRYWKNHLKDFNNNLLIRTKSEEYNNVKVESIEISEKIYEKIKRFCKNEEITINTFIESIWTMVLNKYTKNTDILYGKMVSGRNHIPKEFNIDEQVGIYINIIPQRVKTYENQSFKTLTSLIQNQSTESQKHDYISLELIKKSLKENIDFNSLLIFENYYIEENSEYESIKFYEEFDIPIVLVVEIKDSMTLLIEYHENSYKQTDILKLLKEFETLVLNELKDN